MGNYDDIIDLPHPTSKRHPPMPVADRAAQFAPFAALTGYEDAIEEAARLTDEQEELGEDAKQELNEKLRLLMACAEQHPELTVTYFEPDAKKAGGRYVTFTGCLKRIQVVAQTIEFTSGRKIPIASVLDIESNAFSNPEF